MRQGLRLGIDARDVRRPGVWDGRVTVNYTVSDGDLNWSDTVMLRVAPVLTHHHLQRAERIISLDPAPGPNLNRELRTAIAAAELRDPLFTLTEMGNDPWIQDFFEPGYSSIPGLQGPISIRILIRSFQLGREVGRKVFTSLQGTGVGAIQGRDFTGWQGIDSMGNLETIPPHASNGTHYPAGRIIVGGDPSSGAQPMSLPFLQAQEIQDPIILDTAWLAVGHVDEFMQFLPSNNERGWVIMVADPLQGTRILRNASAQGHQNTKFTRSVGREGVTGEMIGQVLNREDFIGANEECARRIEANLDILRNYTSIEEKDMHRLPLLYHHKEDTMEVNTSQIDSDATSQHQTENEASQQQSGPTSAVKNVVLVAGQSEHTTSLRRRQNSWLGKYVAFIPGMINGIVVTDKDIIVPKPFSPVVDSEDLFETAAIAAYGKVGFTVRFVDSWAYHRSEGELHCGTNTFRETNWPWWKTRAGNATQS